MGRLRYLANAVVILNISIETTEKFRMILGVGSLTFEKLYNIAEYSKPTKSSSARLLKATILRVI